MSAHKKQKSQFKWHPKPVPFSIKVKAAWNRAWVRVVSVGVVIGLLMSWLELKPIIHVDPFHEFDPSTPFSERFKVSNDGKLAIYNVLFTCNTVKVATTADNHYENNLLDAQPYRVETLEASGNTTIYCPFEEMIAHSDREYTRAQIAFVVGFQHLLHPLGTKACFQFLGILDSDKKVQWTYLNNDCPRN